MSPQLRPGQQISDFDLKAPEGKTRVIRIHCYTGDKTRRNTLMLLANFFFVGDYDTSRQALDVVRQAFEWEKSHSAGYQAYSDTGKVLVQ